MRSITIIIAFMAISLQLYSQDIVDPPKVFNKDTLSLYDDNPAFLLGWNWGSQPPHPQNQSFDSMNKGLISGVENGIHRMTRSHPMNNSQTQCRILKKVRFESPGTSEAGHSCAGWNPTKSIVVPPGRLYDLIN